MVINLIFDLCRKYFIYTLNGTKKNGVILEQESKTLFDIFLSHAFSDKEIVLGLRKYL